MILTTYIDGKELRFRDRPDKRNCVVTFYADFDIDSIDSLLSDIDCPSIALRIDDWNRELSPWHMSAAFGKEDFGDGGEDTLGFILDRAIPAAMEELSLNDDTRFVIGGYSLAALFSLWACFRTDRFYAVAAASPSVWFDGWSEFMDDKDPNVEYVYLSLGDTESKTRNQYLSRTADSIERTHDIISDRIGEEHCILVWNEGGHFKDVKKRTVDAFKWILDRSVDTYDLPERL